MTQSHPITNRRPADILFRMPDRTLSASALLGAAKRIASELGGSLHIVNLCRDRACFTIGFVAGLLSGRMTLLTGDRSTSGLAALAEAFGHVVHLTDGDDAGLADSVRVSVDAADAETSFEPPEIDTDRPVALVFTSGSTGRPVAHEKRWGALVERSLAADERFGLSRPRPSSVVGTVPPQHMYGFETTILLPLHTLTTSWSGSGFYPHDIGAALAGVDEPRVLVTTPLHIRALLRADPPLPPLAQVISATAPLDRALAAEAEDRWATTVVEIFGATEVGSIASRRTTATDTWRLYPGVRLSESGGSSQPQVEATLAIPYPLNDVIERLGPDAFKLVGRPTDMLKLGGRRASLSGLNQILASIPGIRDGAFVAPSDLETSANARLTAFVVAPALSVETILAALRERIEGIFLPRRIVHVDSLPRNELGKLPREAELALLDLAKGREAAPARRAGTFVTGADHPALPGHFPGCPIVPGVVVLDKALALISAAMGERLTRVETAKFLAPVLPDQAVTVEFSETRPGRVAFSCTVGGVPAVRAQARTDRSGGPGDP